MSATDLLSLVAEAAAAQHRAVTSLTCAQRRERTDRPGQYALDLIADEAVLRVLAPSGVAIVSEESGCTGPSGAEITVVVDPVDGSTNCARGIPYWAISLCALDADGPLCALVANQATGEHFSAVRGGGAWSGGRRVTTAATARIEDSVLAVSGLPGRHLGWKQFRALGSAALALCDVAAGRIDGYLDVLTDRHAPWDYLGAVLVCSEAGAVTADASGRPLVTADPDARRTVLAACTPALLDTLRVCAVEVSR